MKTLNFSLAALLIVLFSVGCKDENINLPVSDKLGLVKDGIIYFDSEQNFKEAYIQLNAGIDPTAIIDGYENFRSLIDYYDILEEWLQNEVNLSKIQHQNKTLFEIKGNDIDGYEIFKTVRSPYFGRLVNFDGFIGINGTLFFIQHDQTMYVSLKDKEILISKDLNSPLVHTSPNEHIEIESNVRTVCTQEGNPACVSGNNRRVRTALTVTNLLAFAAIDSQAKAQKKNSIGFWVEETAESVELNSNVTYTEHGSPGCPCTVTDVFNLEVFNNDEIHHEIVSYGGTPQVTFSVDSGTVRGEIKKCSGTFVRECTIIEN